MKTLISICVGLIAAHFVGTPVHEFGHWFAAVLLGYDASWVSWGKIVAQPLAGWHLAVVALAGPAMSMFFGFYLWKHWRRGIMGIIGLSIVALNGLLNLLPISVADGGRALAAILS